VMVTEPWRIRKNAARLVPCSTPTRPSLHDATLPSVAMVRRCLVDRAANSGTLARLAASSLSERVVVVADYRPPAVATDT
jgi:hypothetical protein